MSDLCERLQNANEAGTYRLTCPLAVLEANVALSGLMLIDVDMAAVHSKGEFLAAMAQALRAPDWFGLNWDALADVLGDLSWLPAGGYVLLLQGDERLGLNDADYAIVNDMFSEAASYWKSQGKPFWVFFTDGA